MTNRVVKQKQWFRENLYENIVFAKPDKRKKIKNTDFKIPQYHEWEMLLKINFNCSQLKKISKHYKQKVSGNKNDLSHRLINYLKFSNNTVMIQKHWRGRLRRRYNKLKGDACFNRTCTNQTDFLTLNNLTDIEYSQFFSYKDEDGFIYGFNIKSIYNLFENKGELKNPYNRKKFPDEITDNLQTILRMSKILNENIQINLVDDTTHLSLKKIMELKAISLFHKIDTFGHITDINWFITLNKRQSIKYIKELFDIWNYRAQLTNDTKLSVCPPNGMPFSGMNIGSLGQKNEMTLKKYILRIMENLITKSHNTEHQSLGAFYILGAFTLVNNSAANTLPWLYQSVHYI